MIFHELDQLFDKYLVIAGLLPMISFVVAPLVLTQTFYNLAGPAWAIKFPLTTKIVPWWFYAKAAYCARAALYEKDARKFGMTKQEFRAHLTGFQLVICYFDRIGAYILMSDIIWFVVSGRIFGKN